ncbi:Ig-like domain-containing protein [Tindallia californiensis]|uniref:Uncharacterized conserved protein YjdB, contains Ig-like domain n=1 Tax=Tindallia californiensis TaxID=159292 RepID=A0A1H3Q4V1_9FIRM|nr:Ig-like domain-containing protein [Tindallia californiensis]SDZ08260.1 Uncharacterized conserved protein YjdB, contains Ig-like domain [Tindallia californiensis]
MKTKKITGLVVLIYLLTLVLTLEVQGQLPATGISLNRSDITIHRGSSIEMTANLSPEEAGREGIQWRVENPGVATVSPSSDNPLQARIKAVSAGTTTVSVHTPEGHSAKTTIRVVVPVTGINIDQSDMELVRGTKEALTVTLHPSDATNKNLRWSSDDEDVVRIIDRDSHGFGSWHQIQVEAMEAGKTKLQAESQDGNQSASITIEVIVLTEAVVFEEETVHINSGEKKNLLYEIVPADATNQAVWFESTEPSVATVTKEGIVEAHREGAARIIIRSDQDEMIFDYLLILVDGAEAPEGDLLVAGENATTEDPPLEDPPEEGEEAIEEASASSGQGDENGDNRITIMIGIALLAVLAGMILIFRKSSSGEMKRQPKREPQEYDGSESTKQAPLALEEEKIPGRAVIWGLLGEFEGQGIELAENQLIIGRDASMAHVVYPAHREEISRQHLKIEFDPEKGNGWITDLSANGTYWSETGEAFPHGEKVAVKSGDRFYLVKESELFEIEF